AADAALVADPRSTHAAFNRALVLDALDRRDEAIAAWRHVQSLETDPQWRAEEADRLSALERRGTPGHDVCASWSRSLWQVPPPLRVGKRSPTQPAGYEMFRCPALAPRLRRAWVSA